MLRVAAEHADIWNIPGGDIADAAGRSALLDRYCTEAGRDPAAITRSIHLHVSYDQPGTTRDAIGEALDAGFAHITPRPAGPALPGRRRAVGRGRAHRQVGVVGMLVSCSRRQPAGRGTGLAASSCPRLEELLHASLPLSRTVDGYPGSAALTSLARKAETAGCSALVMPDHLIGQYAAMPLLAVVAAASERRRVGTFVLNVCLRHPAVLAQDLATLDVLSGGRLEIGLGAGWNKPEHDAIGIPFEPTGVRIKRLTEAIAVLKGCLAEGPFSFCGEHYIITAHDGVPKPAQRPHPPIFLGGGGKRLLTLAAREAQIIGLAPHVFIGTVKDLARKFTYLRERFGISSFLIDDLDALAPVVEELAGQ